MKSHLSTIGAAPAGPSPRRQAALALAIALSALASTSHADTINGGFESGSFAGWTTAGVTAVIGANGGSSQGLFQAYMDTSPSDSLAPPQSSSISQTFSGGGFVSFGWNFLTNEILGGAYNDAASVTLDGNTTLLANVFSTFVPSTLGGYASMTGYRAVNIALGYTGSHTITFGVRDAVDGGVDSALLIDNVSVVPEPAGALLFAAGLGVLIAVRRGRAAGAAPR